MSQDTNFHLRNAVATQDFLSAEEERELVQNAVLNGCKVSEQRLVMSFMRMIVSLARTYRKFGVPEEDLIQEGTIGFLKSLETYDLDANIRLSTYTRFSIKSYMREHVFANMNIMKTFTTKPQRKVFYNVGRFLNERGTLDAQARERMATELGLTTAEVEDACSRLGYNQYSFADANDMDDENTDPDMKVVADDTMSPDRIAENDDFYSVHMNSVNECMSSLKDRDREIIEARWMADEPVVREDLSRKYGVSNERIRQIENNALKKIKNYVQNAA